MNFSAIFTISTQKRSPRTKIILAIQSQPTERLFAKYSDLEEWLPTFEAAAGAPDIKEKLLKGVELNGRNYKNHLDGYNLLDYLGGKTDRSPRSEFIYINDVAEVVAIRVGDWKAVYLENRAEQLQVWREPFIQLRLPLLFNLRRDPFERAQHNYFRANGFKTFIVSGGGADFM